MRAWIVGWVVSSWLPLVTSQKTTLSYAITEGPSSAGFRADVALDADITILNLSNVQYRVTSPLYPSPGYNLFRFDGSDRALVAAEAVDRDGLCPRMSYCDVTLSISVIAPPEFFQVLRVTIVIKDINDNVPYFSTRRIDRSIPENAPLGSTIRLPVADDLDSPENGVIEYRLQTPLPEFTVRQTVSSGGSVNPALVVERILDRETASSYKLTLLAFDGVARNTTASIEITVNVIDINDNAPAFEQSSYNVSVWENVSVGSPIVVVRALDPDEGVNGEIVYDFDTTASRMYKNLLSIDSASGAIILVGTLDYETNNKYELIVLASEKTDVHPPAEVTLTITVMDVNDNAPVVIVTSLANTGIDAISIYENADAGTFLAHVTVSDGDAGENSEVSCKLEQPDSRLILQSLQINEYKLKTAGSFDYEITTAYIGSIVCQDHGTPPLSTRKNVTVAVLPLNDNSPQFEQSLYRYQLMENSGPGTLDIRVHAADRDVGDGGQVTYHIDQGLKNYVRLDPYNGTLTNVLPFDHEMQPFFLYTIIAEDNGRYPGPLSATALVNITVLDMNDERPTFISTLPPFQVYENQPVGAEVGGLLATDRDSSPEFYNFLYELASDTDLFVLSTRDGRIFTKAVLDRELHDTYVLAVRVYDVNNPSLRSEQNITINVLDRNDNNPFLIFPSADNNSIVLPPAPTERAIGRIIARDPDLGKNAELRFYIRSGNSQDLFKLNEITGFIFMSFVPDALSYTLLVEVMDGGTPSLTRKSELHLTFSNGESSFSNHIILIVVAVISGILITVLLLAIIILKRRDFLIKKKSRSRDVEVKPNLDLVSIDYCKPLTAAGISSTQTIVINASQPKMFDEKGDVHKKKLMVITDASSGAHRRVIVSNNHPTAGNENGYSTDSDSGLGINEENECSRTAEQSGVSRGKSNSAHSLHRFPYLTAEQIQSSRSAESGLRDGVPPTYIISPLMANDGTSENVNTACDGFNVTYAYNVRASARAFLGRTRADRIDEQAHGGTDEMIARDESSPVSTFKGGNGRATRVLTEKYV